ncbi:Hypothetical protein ORPV_860 [Orpheovirus IHUMI-LCC2]|uniref:Uncharacterized protein n=1 Tax=Orpheovirus IHUMI-LCC2 TaxID=2023057 RepID=A0A2I2L5F6_9VIRU|nr:Hypothetical protein ORPV_860 [Orpheovirus IHUMI-LCC2]SNW62764.1 Hypothetical protein ORPV_860 [Orpheovirus IHUMI-LCC2]
MDLPSFTNEEIWEWLGDRGVFFYDKTSNASFNSTSSQMMKCFDYLSHKNGKLYFRLKENCYDNGLGDVMGCIGDSLGENKSDEVFELWTHDPEDGEEFDCIEINRSLKQSEVY